MKNVYSNSLDPNIGMTASHVWMLLPDGFSRWYVCGLGAFTSSGYAVVDNFGNLVEVAQ